MEQIKVFDATLYGGGQSPGTGLNIEERLEIARMLEQMGVDVIQAGFPISSPRDYQAVRRLADAIQESVVCALARAREEDIDVAAVVLRGAARPRIQVGLGVSDSYIVGKLNTTREAALEMAVEAVRHARRRVDDVQYYAADACRADVEYLYQVLEAVIDAGATTVNIPDAIGFLTPSEWGTMIRGIRERVRNIDKAVISVHCHNDLGMATANTLEALLNGARQAECAVNGIGERTGNARLEEIVMTLHSRGEVLGLTTGVNTRLIHPVSRLVSHLTGIGIQSHKAIVGEAASRTPLLAGREGLRRHLGELGFSLEDAEFERVYKRFRDVAKKKPDLEIRDLEGIVSGETMVYMKETFELEEVQVTCGTSTLPVAAVRLQGPEEEAVWATCHGNGPVDATFKAIDSIINVPNELLEYSVEALTEGVDALAKVTVRIEGELPVGDTEERMTRVFLGRGADPDTIIASAKAYVFALNRLLAARRAGRRRQAITEEVRRDVDEMRARYGMAPASDVMGWSILRDESLI